ncbi:MAG TPA: YbdK family carboxylate-amine ligase [Burkholderiales bacterium]|nr:YbdK family carboxylate-amine ligase [Burkholderiales bacterium]
MPPPLPFKTSERYTLGVELELQVLNSRDFDLVGAAGDLLALLEKVPHPGEIKPEITEAMIEVSTGIQHGYAGVLTELTAIRDVMVRQAQRLNLGVAGGGTHPFQEWQDQRIFSAPRYRYIHDLYGYLAKQFTVFGQHVHIGCDSGDAAVWLIHLFSRYIPHFIALSASSPFFQGADTAFASSRLNSVSAFPLAGHIPFVPDWTAFTEYFDHMRRLQVVESMKDFYWDIRPKPEYGTIELRVCDTPLTLERSAALAEYARALARYLWEDRPLEPSADVYRVYGYNRFLACRFGLEAEVIDPYERRKRLLSEEIGYTLGLVGPYASDEAGASALQHLREAATTRRGDSVLLRERMAQSKSLSDVVRWAAGLWMHGSADGNSG